MIIKFNFDLIIFDLKKNIKQLNLYKIEILMNTNFVETSFQLHIL